METISLIAGLVLFVVWGVAIIGLLNPKWLQGKKENSKLLTRKEIALGTLVVSIILIIIGVATSTSTEKKVETSVSEKVAEPQAVVVPEVSKESLKEIKTESNLGMTPEEFRKKFNKRLIDLDISSLRPIAEFNIKNGDVKDVFQVAFSDQINMTGTVNKDGMLREVTFIILPKGESDQLMLQALTLIGISSNVVNENGNKEQIGKAITDLISKAAEGMNKDNNTHSQIVGDVKYYALASKYTGFWYGMSPVND